MCVTVCKIGEGEGCVTELMDLFGYVSTRSTQGVSSQHARRQNCSLTTSAAMPGAGAKQARDVD